MTPELTSNLVARATALHAQVVGHPQGHRRDVLQLVHDARTVGDAEALVLGLRAAAWIERMGLHHHQAMDLLSEAVKVARRSHLEHRLGEALLTRGIVEHEMGRLDAARRDFDQAAALVPDDLVAEVTVQRATLASNSGRLAEAATLFREVLRRRDLSAPVLTKAANNLGNLEAARGRFGEAMRWLDVAAGSAHEVGPVYVASVAETRAWATVQSGRLSEGMALFDAAEPLWKAAEMPLGELHAEYADALLDLNLLPEAMTEARKAADMLEAQHVHLMAAEAALRVARLATHLGDAEKAADLAEAATREFRRQRRTQWAARGQLVAVEARLVAGTTGSRDHQQARRAARTLREAGMSALAVDGFLRAGRAAAAADRAALATADWLEAAELSRNAPILVRLKGHLAAALAAQTQQRHDEVLAVCRRGLVDLARHRTALPSTELRALASGHGAQLGALGLGSLLRKGSPGQVLAWMERTRAAALTSLDPLPTVGLEDEMGALRRLHREIAQARNNENGVEPPDLVAALAEAEAKVRRASWTIHADVLAEATTATGTTTAATRAALGDRTLVEYDIHEGQLVAAVLEPRRIRLVRLGTAGDVNVEVEGLRLVLRALAHGTGSGGRAMRTVAAGSLARLRALLVTPLALPADREVVVVPVGELQRVPWTALLDAPVSVAPSAALWVRSHEAAPPEAGRVLLAAGPELDGAVDEVRALAPLHPGAQVLVPPASTVDTVRDVLGGTALAHLACHGQIRSDNPTFSSLLLADGHLTWHEFDRAAGTPYRLVLAACDVGSSTTYAGNEALGFVGTLLAGGTAGVLASTVPVPDQHVTPLMTALHGGLRAGQTLARSLHAARTGLDREDPESFPAWCAFTAYGAA